MEGRGVEKVCYAILLIALRKRAAEIVVIRRDGRSRVEFLIEGTVDEIVEEMRPPLLLHGPIVRRFGVMASVPYYRKGEHGRGRLTIQTDERTASWDVRLDGHGDDVRAHLVLVAN